MATISPSPSHEVPPDVREATTSSHDNGPPKNPLFEKDALDHIRTMNRTAANTLEPSLPPVDVAGGSGGDGLFSKIEHWAATALTVAEALGKGAIKEVTEHPAQMIKDLAIGAAMGVAIAVAPEVAIPVLLAYSAYQVVENKDKLTSSAKEFAHDVAVTNDPSSYSSSERATAEMSLEGFGAVGAELAAGVAGGMATGFATGLARSAASASESAPTAAAATRTTTAKVSATPRPELAEARVGTTPATTAPAAAPTESTASGVTASNASPLANAGRSTDATSSLEKAPSGIRDANSENTPLQDAKRTDSTGNPQETQSQPRSPGTDKAMNRPTFTDNKGRTWNLYKDGEPAPASATRRYRAKPDSAEKAEVAKEPFTWQDYKGNPMRAEAGDIKITSKDGSIRSVKPEIFNATYEESSPGMWVKTAITPAQQLTEPAAVQTLEGVGTGLAKDYLVTGPQGERYIVPQAKFLAKYEEVSNQP